MRRTYTPRRREYFFWIRGHKFSCSCRYLKKNARPARISNYSCSIASNSDAIPPNRNASRILFSNHACCSSQGGPKTHCMSQVYPRVLSPPSLQLGRESKERQHAWRWSHGGGADDTPISPLTCAMVEGMHLCPCFPFR
jgi:hypothetical protein